MSAGLSQALAKHVDSARKSQRLPALARGPRQASSTFVSTNL